MLIKKQHAQALLNLLKHGAQGDAVENYPSHILGDLEIAGLVSFPVPANAALTYNGQLLANLLEESLDSGLVAPVDEWKEGHRWIASEIISMLDSAHRAQNVPESTWKALKERGFAHEVKDKERKLTRRELNEAGEAVLELYFVLEPNLHVDGELAEVIKRSPMGPTRAVNLTASGDSKDRLENMRLIAYSVPDGDVVTFTGLGQAVKNTLQAGVTPIEGEMISPSILKMIAAVADGDEVTAEGLVTLEELGYLLDEETLSPAGEQALEVYRLFHDKPEQPLYSFAISEDEADVLATIDALWKKNQENPKIEASFDEIKRELVDRKIREYKKLLEEYGRELKEMPKKKQEIARKFADAKDKAQWFEDNFSLRELLYALEAFSLIHTTEGKENPEVFTITDYGHGVLADQKNDRREISSVALKSLMHANELFLSPNREWVEKARAERLLGEFEASKSGRFYEDLAQHPIRQPLMTKYGMEIFKKIPSQGMTVDELLSQARDEDEKHAMEMALNLLEARGFIEILPDGNIVETEAGELMDKAMSGVPAGFGAPINPIMYRVIKAIAQAGSLYDKERKIRILPKHLKQAIKASGLPPAVFEKAYTAARNARYLGKNSVNEAGINVLQAVAAMNP